MFSSVVICGIVKNIIHKLEWNQVLLFSYPYPSSLPTRHKKYKEHKYRPTDAAAANNEESRDAIEMDTVPNTNAFHREAENPTSPVATTGPSTATGATTTTSSSTTATPGPGATGVTTRPAGGSFDLSEGQIKLSRGMF